MTPLHIAAVERMARAMCTSTEQNGGPPWDWHDTKGKTRYLESATAALAALRELLAERGLRVIGPMPPAGVIDELYGPYLNPIASTARRKAWSDAITKFPDPLAAEETPDA